MLFHFKWWVALVIFFVFTGFIGEHSLINRYSQIMEIRRLNKEIADYKEKFEKDRDRLERLKNDPEAIVEVAREQYYMKNEDEDIFIVDDNMKTDEDE